MSKNRLLVLVSANSEWKAVQEILSPGALESTPLGETFTIHLPGTRPTETRDAGSLDTGTPDTGTRFFHGGWGKISAAATTQYCIDHYQPDILVNLGTCGGFAGHIARGAIILVTKTIVYDIIEQMTDPVEAISHYSTDLDLSWLADDWWDRVAKIQPALICGLLISADRDILSSDIPMLVEKYAAVAADWESGAIAWVAKKSATRCLILRGVTDLVGDAGGEAYGNVDLFHENTRKMMKELIEQLPVWMGVLPEDT
jgi:adenosylhomocysteine nucleosidase